MHISMRQVSASIAILFFAANCVQNIGVVQAHPKGYVQVDCPNIVKQAIDTVSAQCGKTARGKLCYGNANITAQFQPGANNTQFSAPGDTVDVSALKQFTLGGMDTAVNSWGVAEMKIKADLPDTDPLQAVTLILFGDVQLTDASNDANTAVVTQTPGAIARQNQNATATTRAVDTKQTQIAATVTKVAGLEATATAHAQTSTPTGTISALKATQAAATVTQLANIINTATAAPIPQTLVPGAVVKGPYSGLQAFYFQSKDSAPCDQAPHDGVLIQSPQGSKQRVSLNIDGATISLGSTVYITAEPGKFLTINTLEGSANVTAAGVTSTANAGMAVQVPLDANLRASGAPSSYQYFTADSVRGLPTGILPTTKTTYALGLPADAISADWNVSVKVIQGHCDNQSYILRIAYDDSTMWLGGLTLKISTDGVYVTTYTRASTDINGVPDGYTVTDIYKLSIISPTHISGTDVSTLDKAGTDCTWAYDMTRHDLPGSTATP